MANEEEVKQEVYYIPENFEDAGGVLGGHFTQRNAIELMVLCGPLAYLEFKFLAFTWKTNIIIMMVTLIPLAALCAFGINGESLSQMLVAFIRFMRKRRKLSYIEFTEGKADASTGRLNFDTILDAITSKGLKGAIQDFKKAREKVAADEQEAAEETQDDLLEEEDTQGSKTRNRKKKKGAKPTTAKASKPAGGRFGGKQGMMNSALKEKLLRKLELGDEDDEENDEGTY